MTVAQEKLGVICVDDNPLVADAVRIKLARSGGFEVTRWLASADELLEAVARESPALVLLDLDMPGTPPLEVARAISRELNTIRIVVFSGHVRADLVEAALDAGAWGYISKNDADAELIPVLQRVSRGEIGFSSEVAAVYGGP